MRKIILFILATVLLLTSCGGATKEDTTNAEIKKIVEEHFDGRGLLTLDEVSIIGESVEVHADYSDPDKENIDAVAYLVSETLAKKLNSYPVTSLDIIYACPKISNVLEAKYNKDGDALVQVSYEFDV